MAKFTYTSVHAEMLARREEWFEQSDLPAYVLFWLPEGLIPTEKEIKVRFIHLKRHGATPHAFTFDQRFSVNEMLEYEARKG